MTKDDEIMNFLEEEVFSPAEKINNPKINKIVRETRLKLKSCSVKTKINFFWICVTDRPSVEKLFHDNGLSSFGDVKNKFDKKFNYDWLKK